MKTWIYGKNAVYEAVKRNDQISEVVLTKENKDRYLFDLCKKNRISCRTVDKKEMNDLSPAKNHQGYLALKESYAYFELEDMLARIPPNKTPLLIMLDGLEDPHNLGAILRSADAIGADGIIIGKNRSVSLNATVAKVSTGAIEYVPVCQVTNLARTLDQLKKQGYWVVGTDMQDAVDYRTVDYDMPIVLVIGSEGFGISRLVLEKCDYKVSIPMVGHVNSLNASVACAVLLYQIYEKRNPIHAK